jgi:hypothetical protein
MPPIRFSISRLLNKLLWGGGLLLLLVGCLPSSGATRSVRFGELLLDDAFDTVTTAWDQYTAPTTFAGYEKGGYRLRTTLQNYVFGLHTWSGADLLVEAEAYVQSAEPRMIYGVICRASSEGRGYYFLVSANGNFSIRRLHRRQDTPLVKWQSTSALYTGTRRNVLRAVCVQDYLAFYINGQFVAEVRDNSLNYGTFGVTVAVAPSAEAGATADVVYDRVRVWSGQ